MAKSLVPRGLKMHTSPTGQRDIQCIRCPRKLKHYYLWPDNEDGKPYGWGCIENELEQALRLKQAKEEEVAVSKSRPKPTDVEEVFQQVAHAGKSNVN